MKKERSIRELLVILKDSKTIFIREECSGLCALLIELYPNMISKDEYVLLYNYINMNRPHKGKHCVVSRKDNAWFWTICEWEPREAWLKDKIRRIKK